MRITNNANNLKVRPEVWICLFLVLSIIVVYYQVNTFDFVHYDTDKYVFNNISVKAGLTAKGISWAFTTTYFSNWHPLPWLSYMWDVQLYGLNPGRHHLTSLLLHIANALLLFGVLRRMTGDLCRCSCVEAFFALHPLHSEYLSSSPGVFSTCWRDRAIREWGSSQLDWRLLVFICLFRGSR